MATTLEHRRSEILRALVEEHIKTGEAVSSRAVLEATHLSVSPATIRNDLASLEREGYVVQPHTSAGRIPTARAYRYFVDHLDPGRLGGSSQMKIAGFFSTVHLELTKLLKATSQLLADVTDLPSVVVAPGVSGDRVRAVHGVQLSPSEILVIAVTEGGRVIQDRARLEGTLTSSELMEAQRIVSGAVVGSDLSSEPKLSDEDRAALGPAGREAAAAMLESVASSAGAGGEVFVGGTTRLTSVFEDLNTVHSVLEVLEREAMVLNLLARVPGTSIQIGAELPVSDQVDMAVVSTTYETGGGAGSVGVIGPMRMDYKRAINAVEEVSRELEDQIGS